MSVSKPLVALLCLCVLTALGCAGLPSYDPCPSREICTEKGQCGTSFRISGEGMYRCYIRDQTDCEASKECDERGLCAYEPKVSLRCIDPDDIPKKKPKLESICDRSTDCVRWGRCEVYEGACMARSDKECERSLDCVVNGKCSLLDHECWATSDADCNSSLECEAYGRCERYSHPLLGSSNACANPDEGTFSPSCIYSGQGADHCAETGECLRAPDGTCETLADVGLKSKRLDEARKWLRKAHRPETPLNHR